MIRVAISVEGGTEEDFVNEVLAARLRIDGVEPYPISLNGDVTVERLASDMAKLFWNFDFVTSLVDFYGFRGKGNATVEELEQLIYVSVARKIGRSFNEALIYPYVQKHEFEGLLFSDVNSFQNLDVSDETLSNLLSISCQFTTPEDINDNTDTAPSKRIEHLIPEYDKRADGPLLALEIGLDKIRSECPRFNLWLARLENLESPP